MFFFENYFCLSLQCNVLPSKQRTLLLTKNYFIVLCTVLKEILTVHNVGISFNGKKLIQTKKTFNETDQT